MSTWFGYNPPFVSNSQVLPFQTDERLIKNDLLQLLLTSPGERVMRPDFGVPIRDFLFEPIIGPSINELRNIIISAIGTYDDRVNVTDVTINTDENNNLMNIIILCSLVASPNKSLKVSLDF